MNYCSNCGNKISENSEYCVYCGKNLKEESTYQNNNVSDEGGFGWGFLGFMFPVIGLILYLVWKNEKPKTAKSVGKGALISFVSGIVLYILMFIIFIFGSMSISNEINDKFDRYPDGYYNDDIYDFD